MWKCLLAAVLVVSVCAESPEPRDYSQPQQPSYHQPKPQPQPQQQHYGGYSQPQYTKPEFNYGQPKLPGYFQENFESWVDSAITTTMGLALVMIGLYAAITVYSYLETLAGNGGRSLQQHGLQILQTIERLQHVYENAARL